ncbi:RHS repeat domain-containing protein [Desulfovibrio sp. Fe33]|uniref:RHS repeat domain-containing protein n=1 Tax=Desulfovibrio sp. Fe33 TaxID=3020842 RepID=UPI00234C210C|nr:RHS repeat-associated core domain-containing protein [Desulfovibrio sp. Fe33]
MNYEFGYGESGRLPSVMRREDGAVFTLHYDQVGSLRVVVDQHGNMIKETLYDPFGGIIEDTNPYFRVPLGFAGGLFDRDLGFVRFGWRDYDPFTGRWTAPDPIGDRGGDPDWYGYCLDDPVNAVDPAGLTGKAVEPIFRQGIKAGIKTAGKKGAEEKPDNAFLQGLDRFLNGKGLDKDPMAADSDGDGISNYDDEDSDWNHKGKAK